MLALFAYLGAAAAAFAAGVAGLVMLLGGSAELGKTVAESTTRPVALTETQRAPDAGRELGAAARTTTGAALAPPAEAAIDKPKRTAKAKRARAKAARPAVAAARRLN